MRLKICLVALFTLPSCAHMRTDAGKRQVTAVAAPSKVEIPSLGVTLVMKEKSIGFPVAAMFDKNGEYYPEIQNKINKKIMANTQVGFNVVSAELQPEYKVYKESRESYATLIIKATTVNGLSNKEQTLKFAVPVERMVISQKGGKASGLGYWNTTDVRVLDPQQVLPF